jgi:hypothetical protein
MMDQESSAQPRNIQPPCMAAWLVGLFTCDKEDQAVPGDLLEEFSQLAGKSGVALARRWYWRQTARTITHLAGAAFRSAPLMMAAVVAGGFLLHGFVSGLPDKFLSVVTDRYLVFWSGHFQAYLWVLNGMLIEHLVLSMFVGCIVALVAEGREIVATMTLALVFGAMSAAAFLWVATHGPMYGVGWMLWSCADPFAIVVGGVIVRTRRLRNHGSSPKRFGITGV